MANRREQIALEREIMGIEEGMENKIKGLGGKKLRAEMMPFRGIGGGKKGFAGKKLASRRFIDENVEG